MQNNVIQKYSEAERVNEGQKGQVYIEAGKLKQRAREEGGGGGGGCKRCIKGIRL